MDVAADAVRALAGARRSRDSFGLSGYRSLPNLLESRAAVRRRQHCVDRLGGLLSLVRSVLFRGAAYGRCRRLDCRNRPDHWRFALRLGIGLVTASATSISGTMLFSHAKIEAQEEKTRDSENAAKRAAGEAEKAQAWQSMLGALDAEVKHAGGEVGALNDRLDAARRLRDAAGQQAVDSKITADCQLTGVT